MQPDFFPPLFRVRQDFPPSAALDIPAIIAAEVDKIASSIRPGHNIAIAVGSRGISNLPAIVRSLVEQVKARGAVPFIIPAMGSHGGATPEGQAAILAHYDITPEKMGAPVRPSLEVQQVDTTPEGLPVYCSTEALQADGVLIVNRIKPHTDFNGSMGSGIMKMMAIGLGKRTGAAACHAAATRLGHEVVLRAVARSLMRRAPVLAGVAIIEDQHHQTHSITLLPNGRIEEEENRLFQLSRRLMPLLPFPEIDLLIVDEIGKNISGAGMDPNVIGRGVQGYSSALNDRSSTPVIRRIYVRDVTPESNGNAIGVGLADFTSSRLVKAMDRQAVFINSLTSLTPHAAKIPIHFETDEEVLRHALNSLALDDTLQARIVRIQNTLSLEELEISEPLLEWAEQNGRCRRLRGPYSLDFEDAGNLRPLA